MARSKDYLRAQIEELGLTGNKNEVTIFTSITQGPASAMDRSLLLTIPREHWPALLKFMAGLTSEVSDHKDQYTKMKDGVEWLRAVADSLDEEAEELPSWQRPSQGRAS